ncbi:shikimate dehydrogenase [Salibacteraceae bacterium]|nr:shikimate dehydrogenase [Salibacteraceae bacterium]
MRHFGLIGYPLTHSFSPDYFKNKFEITGVKHTDYKSFELHDLNSIRRLFKTNDLSGFNVTIPHKQSIIPYLDELTQEANAIGSVNCVKVVEGKLIGYNTDEFGFRTSLTRLIGDKKVEKALVLGNGGSSKAVQYTLQQVGIDYSIVSRSGDLNYNNLSPSMIRTCQLIINTTPLGMFPNVEEHPDIPYEAIIGSHFAFDLIYNPSETAFMRKCSLGGAQVKNGQEMLELQADKSWEIWNA